MKYRVLCSCGIMDDDVCHDTKEDADKELNRLFFLLQGSTDIDTNNHIMSIQEVPEEVEDESD